MQLIAEAEKKLTSSKGFLGSLFGFVNSTFYFVDSSKVRLRWKFHDSPLFLSPACTFSLFESRFSFSNSQAAAPTRWKMPSSATIELRTCLRWQRSGSKREAPSAPLATCMPRPAVVTMQPPTTSMPRTATKRFDNNKKKVLRSLLKIKKYFPTGRSS